MVMRIRVEDLGDEVRERLARGEPVEIERDGEVVARMEPCASGAPKKVDWQAYFEARKNDPPLDYDEFLRELDDIRRELNSPAEGRRWES